MTLVRLTNVDNSKQRRRRERETGQLYLHLGNSINDQVHREA